MNENEYQKMKQQKWNETKKDFLKQMGQIPLGFYLLFTSMLLGVMTGSLIYSVSNITKFNIIIITIFSTISIIMFLFYFVLTLFFLEYYEKSRDLNDKEN